MIYKFNNIHTYIIHNMSNPYCPRCFTCGSCKPQAILSEYMKLIKLEVEITDFTTRGAEVYEKNKSYIFMEDAGIDRICCRRMILSLLNKEIDITRDPVNYGDSSTKNINKNINKNTEKDATLELSNGLNNLKI